MISMTNRKSENLHWLQSLTSFCQSPIFVTKGCEGKLVICSGIFY
jgi:hypothetical protein